MSAGKMRLNVEGTMEGWRRAPLSSGRVAVSATRNDCDHISTIKGDVYFLLNDDRAPTHFLSLVGIILLVVLAVLALSDTCHSVRCFHPTSPVQR